MENQSFATEESKAGKRIFGLFISLGALALFSVAVGWFDNTTELVPSHDNVDRAVFSIAIAIGIISGTIAIYLSKGRAIWRRASLAFSFLLLGMISGFMASDHAANIIEGLIDFPPAKTRSYPSLLLISRAYQTHGKGRSWNIQTTPIWSNLDITEDDYNFMLAHRRPGDDSNNLDEVPSKGYFCAKVTLEQSGDALRVMNAGSHKLPKGTVIVCPAH
ncbi:MAG TPA: hypothetical protein VG893_09360 [Terracidiphilus sp.]|nr:hypothetical protein [Terracidiphilus sp.]